jgi:hypothetical protein
MRNQATKVTGGYRGQVTCHGRVIAETVAAWRVLLLAR